MRAMVVHNSDLASLVAKADQLLAQQHQANGRLTGLKFGALRGGNPVLPHKGTHCRAGPNTG